MAGKSCERSLRQFVPQVPSEREVTSTQLPEPLSNANYSYEMDPRKRKRIRKRLLRKLQDAIEEYTKRIGEQAVVLVASEVQYVVQGTQPLKKVLNNLRPIVTEKLKAALPEPLVPPDDKDLFVLPKFEFDGVIIPVDLMTQGQLRAFIPVILKYSTGKKITNWRHDFLKPPWWPPTMPWANVRMDLRPPEEKERVSWTCALRQTVISCYKYHGREDLLNVVVQPPNYKQYGPNTTQVVSSSHTTTFTHGIESETATENIQSITEAYFINLESENQIVLYSEDKVVKLNVENGMVTNMYQSSGDTGECHMQIDHLTQVGTNGQHVLCKMEHELTQMGQQNIKHLQNQASQNIAHESQNIEYLLNQVEQNIQHSLIPVVRQNIENNIENMEHLLTPSDHDAHNTLTPAAAQNIEHLLGPLGQNTEHILTSIDPNVEHKNTEITRVTPAYLEDCLKNSTKIEVIDLRTNGEVTLHAGEKCVKLVVENGVVTALYQSALDDLQQVQIKNLAPMELEICSENVPPEISPINSERPVNLQAFSLSDAFVVR